MKEKQEKDELRRMSTANLLAQVLDLQKNVFEKTVAAHKNELKNIREIRALKKRLARAKTIIWQKSQIKEQE